MQFAKDILIIDFEATGGDIYHAEPTQLGAILLDKNTLAEKGTFESYIKADPAKFTPEGRSVNKVTDEQLAAAPEQEAVIKSLIEKFGTDVILTSWVSSLDRALFNKMLLKAGISERVYDYHYLDLWPVAYIYLLKRGYTGSMRSEPMFAAFGMPARDETSHDALNDCRLAANILRKICEE
jgi:DNA polymerase III epsilon subunit-like protein